MKTELEKLRAIKLKNFIDKNFNGQKDFAEKNNVSAAYVSKLINPESDTSFAHAAAKKYEEKYQDKGLDLLTNVGDLIYTQKSLMCKLYDVKASAGGGLGAVEYIPSEYEYSVQESILSEFSKDINNYFYVKVEGDSMMPTLHSKDLILICSTETTLIHNCVYLFNCDGEIFVKRFKIIGDDKYLISDNDNGEDDYKPKRLDKYQYCLPLGRVVSKQTKII